MLPWTLGCMYVFKLVFLGFFSRYIPRSGIACSYGSSIFSFLGKPPYCVPQWLHQFTSRRVMLLNGMVLKSVVRGTIWIKTWSKWREEPCRYLEGKKKTFWGKKSKKRSICYKDEIWKSRMALGEGEGQTIYICVCALAVGCSGYRADQWQCGLRRGGYLQGLRNQTALNLSHDAATLVQITAIPSLGLSVCKMVEIQRTS